MANSKTDRATWPTLAVTVIACALALFIVIQTVLDELSVSEDDDYEFSKVLFERISFEDLDGWRLDNVADSLAAFIRSCDVVEASEDEAPFNRSEAIDGFEAGSFSGLVGDWRPACTGARLVHNRPYADENVAASAARSFFEAFFTPVAISREFTPKPDGAAAGRDPIVKTTGLATGYFEPIYPASRMSAVGMTAPIYERPKDLVMADLRAFDRNLAGKRIAGRVVDGRLEPYESHAAINAGALAGKVPPIAFMDPNDLFFLQIQGSGKLVFSPEEEIRVGYAGQNGHPYFAIGRSLIERGEIARENISMQSIRTWLDNATVGEARRLREENASYVFFRRLDDLPRADLGPLGAQGVQLTAERSIAIDRRYYGLGAPIWMKVDGGPGEDDGALFIAQDTGGAIRGPVRADIFLGAGPIAGDLAGRLNADLEMAVLLPNAVAEKFAPAEEPR